MFSTSNSRRNGSPTAINLLKVQPSPTEINSLFLSNFVGKTKVVEYGDDLMQLVASHCVED